ncbi:sugar phosphate isomerase/epimerase [bacterium]|nr:sugar phosphate isomerase/epimerase [bacterium]
MKTFRIGIDNYGLYPLKMNPLEILQWAKDNGAEGVQFSGLTPEDSEKIDLAYLKDMAQHATSHNLYLEWGGGQHIPYNTSTWEKEDIVEINKKAAKQAATLNTRIVRSCSGGLMRWNPENPKTETLLQEMAKSLRSQRQMLKDHNIILAIETHFEFTTHELLRLFEQCDTEPGDYLGICLDTMNLLTMLEDPIQATERILPWVVSTHIKDGALLLTKDGLVTFPAEIGKGVLNLKKIINKLATLPQEIFLSIEDHGGSFSCPIFDSSFLSKFPDLTPQELACLLQMAQRSVEKVHNGQLAIVKRENWANICESRLKIDIQALKELLQPRQE